MKKIITGVVVLSLIVAILFCTGCKNESTTKKNTITVCVEYQYSDAITDVLELWEALHPDMEGEVIELPKDLDARKIKISNIRTELMAGGGPDLFFLSSMETEDEYEMLFTYPEKMMYGDTFLPLDDFLSHAEYAQPKKWNQKILAAGRTDKGQMLLPIFYHVDQYAFPKTGVKSEEIPDSWEELRACENELICNAMYMKAYRFYPLFGRLANFKEGVPAVTKEEILKRADEAVEFIWNIEQQGSDSGDIFISQGSDRSFYEMLSNTEEAMSVTGFPNMDGGINAYVDAYAGINRNTKKAEISFSFLDLLFSDEVLGGSGMKAGEKTMGTILYHKTGALLIDNSCLSMRFSGLSEEDLSALKEVEQQISSVCFFTDLEKDLEDMFWHYLQSWHQGQDQSIRNELVSKLYETMKIKISE